MLRILPETVQESLLLYQCYHTIKICFSLPVLAAGLGPVINSGMGLVVTHQKGLVVTCYNQPHLCYDQPHFSIRYKLKKIRRKKCVGVCLCVCACMFKYACCMELCLSLCGRLFLF